MCFLSREAGHDDFIQEAKVAISHEQSLLGKICVIKSKKTPQRSL
jgi:hypothetical protein